MKNAKVILPKNESNTLTDKFIAAASIVTACVLVGPAAANADFLDGINHYSGVPTAVTTTQTNFTFDPPAVAVDGYKLFVREDGGSYNYALPAQTISSTAERLFIVEKPANKRYRAVARSYKGADVSPNSNEVTWLTLDGINLSKLPGEATPVLLPDGKTEIMIAEAATPWNPQTSVTYATSTGFVPLPQAENGFGPGGFIVAEKSIAGNTLRLVSAKDWNANSDTVNDIVFPSNFEVVGFGHATKNTTAVAPDANGVNKAVGGVAVVMDKTAKTLCPVYLHYNDAGQLEQINPSVAKYAKTGIDTNCKFKGQVFMNDAGGVDFFAMNSAGRLGKATRWTAPGAAASVYTINLDAPVAGGVVQVPHEGYSIVNIGKTKAGPVLVCKYAYGNSSVTTFPLTDSYAYTPAANDAGVAYNEQYGRGIEPVAVQSVKGSDDFKVVLKGVENGSLVAGGWAVLKMNREGVISHWFQGSSDGNMLVKNKTNGPDPFMIAKASKPKKDAVVRMGKRDVAMMSKAGKTSPVKYNLMPRKYCAANRGPSLKNG